MLKSLADGWWAFAMRGAFALLFGVGALAYPRLSLLVLIIFFGAYALVDGVTAVLAYFGEGRWSVYVVIGLVSILAGLLAIARPGATAVTVILVIGIWAVVKGLAEITAAIQIRREVEGEWALALGGVLSVVFGVFVLVSPGAGALALVWLVAAFTLAHGVLELRVGVRLRRLKQAFDEVRT